MTYCTKCGKPTNNGIMCEDCIISDSPWLFAMKSKEDDLVEQIEKFKAENAALRERLERSIELPVPLGETGLCIRKIDLWEDDSPRPLKHGFTWVMTEETYTMEDISDFEKLWFPNTTAGRKAAEARLNELGGWMKNGQ